MAEACAQPRHTLHGIVPGSWIDANFYIWIGHADDRRGWDQLASGGQKTPPVHILARLSLPPLHFALAANFVCRVAAPKLDPLSILIEPQPNA